MWSKTDPSTSENQSLNFRPEGNARRVCVRDKIKRRRNVNKAITPPPPSTVEALQHYTRSQKNVKLFQFQFHSDESTRLLFFCCCCC